MSTSSNLAAFCRARGIRIRQSTDDVVVLHRVPINGLILSKATTNLCAAKVPATGQFVVLVDPNLQARENDAEVARHLSGMIQGQWQLVEHKQEFVTAEQAIMQTIELLNRDGSEMDEASERQRLTGNLLPQVGSPITGRVRTLFHRESSIEMATRLFLHGSGLVVLAGPSGCGLTICAEEVLTVSRRVQADRGDVPHLVRLDCGLAAAETIYPSATDERMRQLVADCLAMPNTWYLWDNIQWPLGGRPLAQAALVAGIERGLRGIATYQTDVASCDELLPSMRRRLHWLNLPALDAGELAEVLALRADMLHTQEGLQVEPETLTTCLQMARSVAGADPARSLELLESAASLVRGTEQLRVGPDEVAAVTASKLTN